MTLLYVVAIKAMLVKEYFANYFLHMSDVTFRYGE
jgi:general stress protein CsbA